MGMLTGPEEVLGMFLEYEPAHEPTLKRLVPPKLVRWTVIRGLWQGRKLQWWFWTEEEGGEEEEEGKEKKKGRKKKKEKNRKKKEEEKTTAKLIFRVYLFPTNHKIIIS